MNPLLLSASAFETLRSSGLLPALDRDCVAPNGGSARNLVERTLAEGRHSPPQSPLSELCLRLELELGDFPREEQYRSALLRYGVALSKHGLPGLQLADHPPDVAEAALIYAAHESAQHPERGSAWSWRHLNRVSSIRSQTHGDLSFLQYVLYEPDLLFPEIAASRVESRGFALHQDAAPLLVSLLLFAEACEATVLPELLSYRELIRAERSNVWGTPDVDQPTEPRERERAAHYFGNRLLGSANSPDAVRAFRFSCAADTAIVPRFENGELQFLRLDERGEICDERLGPRRWSDAGVLTVHDLGDALRGIYRAYVRSPMEMLAILETFLARHHP